MLYYCLVKESGKRDDRCSLDDDVRAGRGSPCAILLLWFSMAASSPWFTRPAPSHLLSLTLNSSRFPFSPTPKNQMLHAVCGADLKNKNSRSGRVQSVSSPPVDAQSPSSFVVESCLLPAHFPPRKPRLRRSVARGGACLRARASRLSIAAPPLLPRTARES